jgi:hypothetical protein
MDAAKTGRVGERRDRDRTSMFTSYFCFSSCPLEHMPFPHAWNERTNFLFIRYVRDLVMSSTSSCPHLCFYMPTSEISRASCPIAMMTVRNSPPDAFCTLGQMPPARAMDPCPRAPVSRSATVDASTGEAAEASARPPKFDVDRMRFPKAARRVVLDICLGSHNGAERGGRGSTWAARYSLFSRGPPGCLPPTPCLRSLASRLQAPAQPAPPSGRPDPRKQ